jgi:hypothetical protein
MIPEPTIMLRCSDTIGHAKVSAIIAEAVGQDQPHLPLFRPLLASQITLAMPSWYQPVPLTVGEDPEHPTVVYLNVTGVKPAPHEWVASAGLMLWATMIIMFGNSMALCDDKTVREGPYNLAIMAATGHKRVLIIRVPDDHLEDWESIAAFCNPGVAISLRPDPHLLTAGGAVAMGIEDCLTALGIPPAEG